MGSSTLTAIAPACRKAMDRAFTCNPGYRSIFDHAVACHFKDGKSSARLEAFVAAPGFRGFVNGMLKATPGRFSDNCEVLFERLLEGDNPAAVAVAASRMATRRFRAIASALLRPPGDREGYRRFLSRFIELSVRLGGVGDEYLELFSSPELARIKEEFRDSREACDSITDMLLHILTVKKSLQAAHLAAGLLLDDSARTLILMSEVVGMRDVLISSLTHVFTRHPDPERFFRMLRLFCKHYRPTHFQSPAIIEERLARLADLWRVFWTAGPGSMKIIGGFIETFGHDSSHGGRETWGIVLESEPAHALEAMEVMLTPAFRSLNNRFGREPSTMQMLKRHLVAALSMEAGKTRDAQVNAILNAGIEIMSMRRRADFYDWFFEKPRPKLVIEIVNGYCFHEYVTAAATKSKHSGCTATSFKNEGHKVFCALIDGLYRRRDIVRDTLFTNILKHIQDRIWSPITAAFPANTDEMTNIRAIAEMAGIEDGVISALGAIEAVDLKNYHDHLLTTWLDSPKNISQASRADDWQSVTFEEAVPFCLETIIPLIGMIGVRESGNGMAYTTGKVIFLPSRIGLFNDPRAPLEANRNLAAYIAMSLHEAGHIVGGSYHFNTSDCISRFERPELFRMILNVFEDFRIETFIDRIHAHPQARELFNACNSRQSARLAGPGLPAGARFLLYIFDTAGGYNSDLLALPDYQEMITALMNRDLPSGRFGSTGELAAYGIEELRNLDVANPLSSFKLAEEFYAIMREWPEEELEGMSNTIMLPPPEVMKGPGSGSGSKRPLTREEMDELYRLFNRNPASALERHGLRAYPALFSNGDKREAVPENFTPDFENRGTMDKSTRTLLDDAIASRQIEDLPDDLAAEIVKQRQAEKRDRDPLQEIADYNHKARTPEKPTEKYTRLPELKEYPVRKIDSAYMTRFRQYEPIVNRVYRELSRLLPAIEDEHESSTDEGELDPDLLVEVMSDRKNRPETPELFETIREGGRRSLEVVIGMDASGSTGSLISAAGVTILDVEKAFSMILGRALEFITPDVRVYAFDSATSTNVYRAETFQAVSSFRPGEGNRDGDFIRYLTCLLKESSDPTP